MKIEDMRKIAQQRTKGTWRYETYAPDWDNDETSYNWLVKTDVPGYVNMTVCENENTNHINGKFIALAANTFDILLEIAEAAKKHIPSERNYCAKELNRLVGYDVYGDLKDALKKLEEL